MPIPFTVALLLLALLSLATAVLAWVRLFRKHLDEDARWQRGLTLALAVGIVVVDVIHAGWLSDRWRPFESHLDGLLTISLLLAGTILFLDRPGRLRGIGAFGLPILTLLLAWAICASQWTLHLFHIQSVWVAVHLFAVYCGTLFCLLSGGAAVMFLFAEHRLRRKQQLDDQPRLASLEAIEKVFVRSAAVGFALLTIVLAVGVVETIAHQTRLGPGWWHAPKVVLGFVSWLVYFVIVYAQRGGRFRGRRTAWLGVAGMVALIVTIGVAVSNAGDRGSDIESRKSSETLGLDIHDWSPGECLHASKPLAAEHHPRSSADPIPGQHAQPRVANESAIPLEVSACAS